MQKNPNGYKWLCPASCFNPASRRSVSQTLPATGTGACALVAALLFILLAGAPALAQQPVGLGLTPFGTFQSTGIDSVNISNDNLVLHAPLISFPQRGNRLRLRFEIVYNGGSFALRQDFCDPLNGKCSYSWEVQGSYPEVKVVDDQSLAVAGQSVQPSPGVNWIIWSAKTPDGGSHLLMELPNSSGFRTVDTTGIYAQAVGDGAGGWEPGNEMIDAHGVQYFNYSSLTNGAYTRQDPDGNVISYNQSTGIYTDTMGRTIPFPATPVRGGDATGCRGPLPVDSVALWTLPGVSGGAQQIKLCYASVTLSSTTLPAYSSTTTTSQLADGMDTLQSVVEYNGSDWTTSPVWVFEYAGDGQGNQYGDLTRVTLPTGGTISYQWGERSVTPATTRTCRPTSAT